MVPETAIVDFGGEDARELFVSGFSGNETTGDSVSFVWSDGGESELRLSLSEPRALSLTFRYWPFGFDGAPGQTLTLVLNDHELTKLELASEPGEYHVSLPVEYQVGGDNKLRFLYGYHRAPSEVISGVSDDRRLGVGWDWLRVDGAFEAEDPLVGGADATAAMNLPAGVRIDYFVRPSPDSRFVVDAVRPEKEGALTVSADTLSTHVERRFDAPSRRAELELPSSGEITRISLQAFSEDVVLQRPVIVTSTAQTDTIVASVERRPNIIVYLIDTLRADHLSCYGYSKSTPRIDALAVDGTLFERALAQSSWTKPATASILTGLHPRAHTANQREDGLPAAVRTLPEDLQELGYETAALVVNTNVSAIFGFDRGFDTFELLLHDDGILGARGDQLIDRAVDWVETRPKDAEPFFLYLHTADPHDPYATAYFDSDAFGSVSFMESLEDGRVTLSPDELTRLVELYDEDVAFADSQFGRFIDALKAEGLYEDALIILVSDHGEEFDDHGRWRHGKTLYGEQLHVPLIIKWSQGKGAGRRIHNLAQHIDLVPTVLDYVGGPRRSGLLGRSLWRLVDAGPYGREPAVLSYLLLDGREVESVVVGNDKLIRYLDYDRPIAPYQLFDVEMDRREATTLARDRSRRADFLEGYLRHAAPTPEVAPAPVVIDEDTERQLRALGYIR